MTIASPARMSANSNSIPVNQQRLCSARFIDEPFGGIWVARDERGIIQTGWTALADPPDHLDPNADDAALDSVVARLRGYLAGEMVDFRDVSIPPGTEFRRACWSACRDIPHGETLTYGELAAAIGLPRTAARAVGQAMRHNPQPIITPCHRVLAQAGGLHGYAGSLRQRGDAVQIKRSLLDLEGAAYAGQEKVHGLAAE